MLHFVHREATLACVESNSLAFPACFPFRFLLIVFKDPGLDTLPSLVHREAERPPFPPWLTGSHVTM